MWDPWQYVEENLPDVQVVTTDQLPAALQGCVDHRKRTIWLSSALSPVEARSTLAYEIGWLLQGPRSSNPCVAAAQERAAVDWAALMLVESEDFVAAWGCAVGLPEMAAMVGVDLPTFRARIRAASNAEQDAAVEAIGQSRLSA